MAWKQFKTVASLPQVNQLISKLNYKVRHEPRRIRNLEGSYGRLKKLRKVVTALVKHERIELDVPFALEGRGYAERLISEAIRHGDTNPRTMEFADWWLDEKQLVHKLFKVLVPRFESYTGTTYTAVHAAPTFRSWKDNSIEFGEKGKMILELKGNPFPPVNFERLPVSKQIHNVLLNEVRREFYEQKHGTERN